ncbi:MAG TPA: MATE family efflux transporter, partial [Polyangia bacterium]
MPVQDDELRTLLRLAGPLILGYAGGQLMSMTDAAMVGRLGADALAGVSIGNGIYFTVTCLGIGCVLGIEAPIAQAFGAGERLRARRLLWQGVRVALGVSLPLLVIMALLPSLLPAVGIDAATARQARA